MATVHVHKGQTVVFLYTTGGAFDLSATSMHKQSICCPCHVYPSAIISNARWSFDSAYIYMLVLWGFWSTNLILLPKGFRSYHYCIHTKIVRSLCRWLTSVVTVCTSWCGRLIITDINLRKFCYTHIIWWVIFVVQGRRNRGGRGGNRPPKVEGYYIVVI